MKKAVITAAMLALMSFQAGGGAAADSAAVREADKAEAIQRIMQGKTFYAKEPEKPFCRQFLDDFRVLKDMSFVEPVARAEHYDYAVLKPYKERCGDLPLNEKFACEPGDIRDVVWSEDPKEKRRQALSLCRPYTGTANFRVFDLDIDGDPKNGNELVVYFERAYGTGLGDRKGYWDGGYNVFDGRNCAQIGEVPTHDPYSYFWKRPLENYSGILFCRGRYYIFDLFDLDPSGKHGDTRHYYLNVSTVGSDRSHWCSYSTIPLRRSPAINR